MDDDSLWAPYNKHELVGAMVGDFLLANGVVSFSLYRAASVLRVSPKK